MNPENIHLELQVIGAKADQLQLNLPDDMALDEWAALGRKLCRSDQVIKWWIGDWAAFRERKYGKLKDFATMNNLSYQTIANLAWVSKAIEVSRRRESLEWSKHSEVAALEPKEQDKWLAKTDEEKLPVSELRRQIRQSQGKNNALISDGPSIKFISKSFDDSLHWLEAQPEEFWTEDRREVWRKRLEPFARFYERLA